MLRRIGLMSQFTLWLRLFWAKARGCPYPGATYDATLHKYIVHDFRLYQFARLHGYAEYRDD